MKKLKLIEKLAVSEEYVYETDETINAHKQGGLKVGLSRFSLLALAMLRKADWKDIAYLQQMRRIKDATKLEIQFKNYVTEVKFLSASFESKFPDVFKQYQTYLLMGDAYVNFVTNQNDWDQTIRDTYKNNPQQVNEYLQFMAERLIQPLLISNDLATMSDDD